MAQKIIIIGAGVSGLAAAASLAKRGCEVHVFEANDKIGGSSANTIIDGYTFNDGAMYLVMPALLNAVFDRTGVDTCERVKLRPILNNSETHLPDGTITTIDNLDLISVYDGRMAYSVRHEIEPFVARWMPVYERFERDILQQPFSMWQFLRKMWRFLPMLNGTVAQELNQQFRHPSLKAALSGALLYLGIPPEEMPIFSILGLIAMLNEGFFLPEGGMGQIPNAFARAAQRHGATIHLNSRVKRIMVEHGRVCGVDIERHGLIPTDYVLSTVSGMLTFGKLLAPEHVPTEIRHKLNRTRLSHRAISLQLGLKNRLPVTRHSVNIIPHMDQQHAVFAPEKGHVEWLSYTVPTVTVPELAPPQTSIIETYLPVSGETDERCIESMIHSALHRLSGLHELDIAVQRVRKPSDFAQEMHLYQGALYGLSPAAGFASYFANRTAVEGLFQAGQTTYPGMGVVTSAMSGIFAADQIIT